MRTQKWTCRTCNKEGHINIEIEDDEPVEVLVRTDEAHKAVSPNCQDIAEPLFDVKDPESVIAFKQMVDLFSPGLFMFNSDAEAYDSIGT